MLRQFRGTLIFTLLCLIAAAGYGWYDTHSFEATASLVWIVLVLAVLEISLSFDNAVVNAKILSEMEPIWRQRFLTWGMVVAVFGMRILFPLVIVAVAAHLGPIEALKLSLEQPQRYETLLRGAHISIAGFGGAFLLLVGISFFFNSDKQVHWLGWVERRMSSVGGLKAVEYAVVLLALYGVARLLPDAQALSLLVSGIMGMLCFIAVEAVNSLLSMGASSSARTGLGAFIYLNVLDASFSFDGVIGGFALSNNMIVIALGLAIGAMFVRSLTIMLSDHGVLADYVYLEHGAFWAIIALGVNMLLSARYDSPDSLTGLLGAGFILLSLIWSIRHRRRSAQQS